LRNIDLENEVANNRKRKKRAVIWATISSSVLAIFVIISYLGWTVGEYLANVTTITFNDQSDEVGITEVGFRVASAIPQADQEKYELAADNFAIGGEGYVYWTSNTVSGQTLRYIINHTGYSKNNSVLPMTSKRFVKGDPIVLYAEPATNSVYPHCVQDTPASKDDYVAFTLLFRVAKYVSETQTIGAADYGIFIGKDIQFYGSTDIQKALRFGFESSLTSDIVSPGRNAAGEIAVGGPLDLDRNGYYDSTPEGARLNPEDSEGAKYEIAYGDFINPLQDSDWGPVTTEAIPASDDEELSFYHAGTAAGVRPLVNYIPAIQNINSFDAYKADNEASAPMGFTNAKGVAEITFTMWLEGWDPSSGDHLRDKSFGANLRFTAATDVEA
jgi:hypothetical protein